MLDGSFKYCKKEFCPHLTSISGPVKFVDDVEYDKYKAMVDGEKFYPTKLNCSYDKSCNLTCPSCRSSLVMIKGEKRETIDKIGDLLIEELGGSLNSIYITGSGDPFASKHYLRMLTSGVLRKYATLKLHLHTNAQLFSEEVWNRLKIAEDKIDILEVSIDGATKKTYEENRKPGKWETLTENMDFLSRLKSQNLIRHFKISFVVQANNYHEMLEFIELGKRWSADLVYFSTLNNWGTYSDQEYLSRAIHKKEHAMHPRLLDLLRAVDSTHQAVELGYFNGLMN